MSDKKAAESAGPAKSTEELAQAAEVAAAELVARQAEEKAKADAIAARAEWVERRRKALHGHLGPMTGQRVWEREKTVDFDPEKIWPNPWALQV